ncbi:AfsR/SARP family transcriptional regulator, partial [Sinomonas atrocyanea]
AASSLRATVFRISHQLPGLLAEDRDPLCLSDEVRVDAHALRDAAQGALTGTEPLPGLAELLGYAELLPGWYEDWLLYEQERFRQLRMAALEAHAARLLGEGRHQAAIAAALHAAAIEPLDESAQALLIRGQVSAGNEAGAYRTYEDFRKRLAQEMGLEPSDRLTQLLPAGPPGRRRLPPGPEQPA